MTTVRGVAPPSSEPIDGRASIGPLPFAMTPLIGRDAQVAIIAERLRSPEIRLMTLIGPGGIGKTRLALEAAHAVRGFYADGAHLLRFASVTDATLVPVTLARALDVRGSTDDYRAWALARDRRCLLLIDNFEQLLAAAPAVVDVLSRCPDVTMLITSRVPLHVSGEHQYQVPTLATPLDDASDPASVSGTDAVRLFVDRAVAVKPDFRLTAENVAAVGRITRVLDGLPLAIELAAAQTKHFSPWAIVERLANGDVLRGGPVDRPPHQRAVRATIAWSYDLLHADDQRAFRRVSIFAGGFLARAAAFVCATDDDRPDVGLPDPDRPADYAALERCISLADRCLVFKTEELRGEPRFSMLLTIRGFALAELQRHGEADEVAQRHAAWFRAFADVAARAIRGPSQSVWLDWVQVEQANLRLALEWHRTQGDVAAFATMANDLSMFWLVRGHLVEGLRWLQLVIATSGFRSIAPPLRADLLCAAGWLALRQGLPEIGREYAEESLATARASADPVRSAAALRLLGDIEDRITHYTRARELLRESLVSYREAGDGIGIADTLTGLAGIAMDTGEYDEAERVFREAVAAATATGDAIILARAIDSLSVVLHVKEDSAQAIAYAERALDLYRTHGNVRGIAVSMDHVGKCSRSLGDLDRAWSCHRDSLPWRRKVGDPRGMAVWLEAMAGLLASCDAFEAAARVMGGSHSLRERGGFPIHNHERAQLEPTVQQTRDHLTPERFAEARAHGSLMSLPEVVVLAQTEAERAVNALRGGEDDERRDDDAVVQRLAERGLTAREREVAQLLTMRLTDKEIAARLSISPRTASTHVAVILGKLGVHSRHDVARSAGDLEIEQSGTRDR